MAGLWFRVLTFRASEDELRSLGRGHLVAGLISTWIVGIGRYWDHPRATTAQVLGLGSVAYVFVLAAVLWVAFGLLRPQHLSYRRILTFLTLTSPPALLYAIPVERFMPMDLAVKFNLGFLAVVAIWRIALTWRYATRGMGLSGLKATVGLALPILAIIIALASLNLDHVVFEFMGGVEPERTGVLAGREAAYATTFMLSILSMLAFIPVALIYLIGVLAAWQADPDPSPPAPAREAPQASEAPPPPSSP